MEPQPVFEVTKFTGNTESLSRESSSARELSHAKPMEELL